MHHAKIMAATLGAAMLTLACSGDALCGAPASSKMESFSPVPYIERANARAAEELPLLQEAAKSGTGVFTLKKGAHAIAIKGREPNTRLERLCIVREGQQPDAPGGIALLPESAAIESPMRLESIEGGKTFIGGEKAGAATFKASIPETGNYIIWAKAWGPDESSNSFRASVDNGAEMAFDVPASSSGKSSWVRVKGRGMDYYSQSAFWLSWAACSPHSKLRDNPELRKAALLLVNTQLDKLSKRPVYPAALWFLEELETVRLWQEDSRTPKEEMDRLMAKVRPCVDSCLEMADKGKGWTDWSENAPNIQLQSATLLLLASEIWKRSDPQAAKAWAKASGECLARAWAHKLPKGGFRYSYDSGVDAHYFADDMQHLTRMCMLSKDPKAAEALREMASIAQNSNCYGQPVLIGSPWWKHCYDSYNSSDKISELALMLSQDPQYGGLVASSRKRLFSSSFKEMRDGLMSYYNMSLAPFSAPVEALNDACMDSSIENGPTLRMGGFSAAMPYRKWCESTAGACYANGKGVQSEVCSVILAPVLPGTDSRTVSTGFSTYRESYQGAYSIIADESKGVRATVCGDDFIASANVFQPEALKIFAKPKGASPWQRTEMAFADKNGFACSLEIKALQDNNCERVSIWTRVSVGHKEEAGKIKLPGLTLSIECGSAEGMANLGKIWGFPGTHYPLDLLEQVVKRAGSDGFKKGETFSATAVANVEGSKGLAIYGGKLENCLRRIEITLGGKPCATLLFNESDTKAVWTATAPGRAFLSDKQPGSVTLAGAKAKLEIGPKALAVFRP